MTFAHPWALVLLSLLPLLWLVRPEPPRQRHVVAARFLWAPRRPQDPSLGKTFNRRLLRWLQAALLGALVLALAGPRIDRASATVALVLDTSMSMGAQEPGGSRMDTARRRAVAALSQAAAGSRVRVWAAGGAPAFAGEADASELAELLATVPPSDGWADLEAAIARAAQDRPQPSRVYVISDRPAPIRAANLEWLTVGQAVNNVAVSSLAAARDDGQPDRLQVLAAVSNFGVADARTEITIDVGDLPPTRRTVQVAARRTATVGVTVDQPPSGAVIAVRIEAADALSADNVRYALVPPLRRTRVAVEGQSRFLEAALSALPGVVRVASSREAHDILVCVGCPADPPGDAGLLRVALAAGDSPVPLTVTRADHPAVRGIALDALRVVPARATVSAAGDTVVARAGSQPVLLAGDSGPRRVVELRFDVDEPGLALQSAFPLLVANIVDWLAAGRVPPAAIRAGDPFNWRVGTRAAAAPAARGPDGRPLEVAATGDSLVVAATSRAGAYRLDAAVPVTFVANPATDDESDLLDVSADPVRAPSQASPAPINLAEPVDLVPVLLVIALALVLAEWRTRFAMSRSFRRTFWGSQLVTRVATVIVLAAALAGLRLWTGQAPLAIAFVLDRSDSTAALFPSWLRRARELAASLEASDRAGLTVFGDTAVVERRVQEGRLPAGAVESSVTPSGSNLERALQVARASLPPDGDRRMLLFSDGRQTSGDAVREAARAAADGVRIDVLEPQPGRPTARATRITAPATVRQDEPFDVVVVVEGPAGVAGTVRLLGPDGAREEPVTLPQSRAQIVTFPSRGGAPGLQTFLASFTPDIADFAFEGDADRTQAGVVVSVSGAPRALYVGDHAADVTPVLRASGFRVDGASPAGIPAGPQMVMFDAVVLDEVDPLALSPAQRAALVQYVDAGGGLLLLGNEDSLPGSSGDADFDTLSPVDPRPRSGERGSALALVVAFDKSGSMEERAGGTPKIEFARQAVRNVVAAVPRGDAVGVIAFDSAPVAVAPLGTSRSAGVLENALRAVRPEGGTAIAPALAQAADWLNAPAAAAFERRHVLLISDGQTSAEDLAAARRAVESGRFALSVVAVGAGPDREALESLARGSGGRAYFAGDVRDLPNTVAREARRVAGGRAVVAEFRARLAPHPLASGLEGAPPLGGYVVTAARPGTEVVLRSHLDDPVLALGRRGLGRVAVYTAGLHSQWSARFVRWPGFATLLTRTVRWVSRATGDGLLHASMRSTPAGIEIEIEAADGAALLATPLELRGSLRTPLGAQTELVFTPLAAGRYRATAPGGATGSYHASISAESADGTVQSSLIRGTYYAAAQELDDAEPDLALLRQVAATAGGRVLSPGASPAGERRAGYRDGRPWFIGVALLLLFGDLVLAGVVRAAADVVRRALRPTQEQIA